MQDGKTYEVIARKWRPKVFEDLIGQEHIARTLKNAIVQNRVAHAYLFAGLRGIGKTSSARVFARALRCERRLPEGNPCNTCVPCEEILKGSSIDVLEIDGASNNGVDSIRELRESAHYMPSSGHYKIYIIDEVHMLSQSAFNALLKILEEPPPHLIFMLATTEAEDIPETILSRVQQFDFKRVPEKLLMQHLQHICDSEKIAIEPGALHVLASASEGSMRDSQSMLDQLIAFSCGAPVTSMMAEEVLGLVGSQSVEQLLECVVTKNFQEMIALIERMNDQGLDFKNLCTRIIETSRDCYFYHVAGKDILAARGDDAAQRVIRLSQKWDPLKWRMLFQLFTRGYEKLHFSPFPKLSMEMLFARAMTLDEIKSIEELVEQSRHTPAPQTSPVAMLNAATTPVTSRLDSKESAPEAPSWSGFLNHVRTQRPMLAASLEGTVAQIQLPSIMIDWAATHESHSELIKDVKTLNEINTLASSYFKSTVKIQWKKPAAAAPAALTETETKTRQVMDDERVRMAQKYLGAEVESIRVFHED